MNLICRISGSLVVAAVIACSADGISIPKSGLSHSFAQFACGPADGPAVAIYLTSSASAPSPEPPYVRVYIAESIDQLDGRPWGIGGPTSEAGAWFEAATGPGESATSGYIIATKKGTGTDAAIEGSLDLTFPRAGHVRAGFHAPVVPTNFRCA